MDVTADQENQGVGRKVVVVGAGPVGVAAAEVMEDRGWNVTVLEARSQVEGRGGSICFSERVEFISWAETGLAVCCESGLIVEAERCVLAVPDVELSQIMFAPALTEEQMGQVESVGPLRFVGAGPPERDPAHVEDAIRTGQRPDLWN